MVIEHQLNPDKYSQQELDKNAASAADADAAAYAAAYATYASSSTSNFSATAADATYWINEYFRLSGECEQDYIDAISKDK